MEEQRNYMRICGVQACAIDDIEVSAEMFRVLACIGSYATKFNSYWCDTPQKTMAARLGVTRQAVSGACKRLEELGYIAIRHEYDPVSGKQKANGIKLLLDFELPIERSRTQYPRPRAGIGGRKGGATPIVAGGATPIVAGGATPIVAGGATPIVAPLKQDLETGSGNRIFKQQRESISVPVDPIPLREETPDLADSLPTADEKKSTAETQSRKPEDDPSYQRFIREILRLFHISEPSPKTLADATICLHQFYEQSPDLARVEAWKGSEWLSDPACNTNQIRFSLRWLHKWLSNGFAHADALKTAQLTKMTATSATQETTHGTAQQRAQNLENAQALETERIRAKQQRLADLMAELNGAPVS